MSEMVARVAEAIRRNRHTTGGVEVIAAAAINAMREPTQAQYDALCATGKTWRELDSATVWRTYVDAALKGAPMTEPAVRGVLDYRGTQTAHTFPDGETIISMTVFEGRLIVATNLGVYSLVDGIITPIPMAPGPVFVVGDGGGA